MTPLTPRRILAVAAILVALLVPAMVTTNAHAHSPATSGVATRAALNTQRYVSPSNALVQARAALRISQVGRIIDRGFADGTIRLAISSTGPCEGVFACAVPGTPPLVWVDWDIARTASPYELASVLAHEATHALEHREYGILYYYFRGEAGLWTETRAALVQARVAKQLGLPPHQFAQEADGRLRTPEETARAIRTDRFYSNYYKISAYRRPALWLGMNLGNPYVTILTAWPV